MKLLAFIFVAAIVALGMEPADFLRDDRDSTSHIFASCFKQGGVDEFLCGAGGKIERTILSLSFFSSFHQLDSLYEQSYSEMDLMYKRGNFRLGAGYGFSMEWSPGEAQWSRHLYRGRGEVSMGNAYLSVSAEGWLSDYEKTFRWMLVGGFRAGTFGDAFALWDGRSVVVGNEVYWKYFSIRSSYGFPEFEIALRVSFFLGNWVSRAHYVFLSDKREWFGQEVKKRF